MNRSTRLDPPCVHTQISQNAGTTYTFSLASHSFSIISIHKSINFVIFPLGKYYLPKLLSFLKVPKMTPPFLLVYPAESIPPTVNKLKPSCSICLFATSFGETPNSCLLSPPLRSPPLIPFVLPSSLQVSTFFLLTVHICPHLYPFDMCQIDSIWIFKLPCLQMFFSTRVNEWNLKVFKSFRPFWSSLLFTSF